MEKLNSCLKNKIKNFLLLLIKKLDDSDVYAPNLRLSKNNIFKKEIKIKPAVTGIISYCLLFFMIVMQLGLTYQNFIFVFIFLSTIFLLVIFYFTDQEKENIKNSNVVMLMCFITIISFLFFQILQHSVSMIAFPISAFAVLLSLLISIKFGLIYIMVMVTFMLMVNGFHAALPIMHVASALVALINVRQIHSRSQFSKIGFKVFIVMAGMLMIFHILGFFEIQSFQLSLWFAMLNSFMSVLIILATLPLFEMLFSRTTNIKLVELSDFNSPLLKRLMVEAPGTYHHSLIAASLAEQAAAAIGADSLLTRTGAYYHDIGKLKNPEYFIENQNKNENPHDNLSPSMSGLVLISHVKDGVALARKYKIDEVIVDFIRQHHGTSLIQYFYFRALENSKDVNEQDFRYPGNKPTSKETAILMIADSVEAISRIIPDKNAGKLKELVEKVINNKFTDGQFSDCSITLNDLAKIADSMTSTLCGIYHARIDYKKTEEK